jgi:hypothetical protein
MSDLQKRQCEKNHMSKNIAALFSRVGRPDGSSFRAPEPLTREIGIVETPARLDPTDWLTYRRTIGLPTIDQRRSLPDFLVISPAKTATTWLAVNLNRHPRILVPAEKEVRYFDLRWRHRSIDWYCSRFTRESGRLACDVSPSYALLPSFAIEHVHSIMPDLKIMLLLRDLPSRAWSHLKHTRVHGEANFVGRAGRIDDVEFDDLISNLVHDYTFSTNDYEGIIRRWLKWFPKEQFHIAFFEDAVTTPKRYFARLFAFLGVDAETWLELEEMPVNEGDPSPAPAALAEWMEAIYTERRRSLARYLKQTFNLTPPWPNVPIKIASTRPRPLPNLVAHRAVEFDRGLFWDVEDKQVGSAQFLGDLLRTRDPASFSAEYKLRDHGTSLEDLRLVHELDRFAEKLPNSNEIVEQRSDHSPSAERTLNDWSRRIVSLEASLAERDQRLRAVEATLAERDQRLRAVEATLAERDQRRRAVDAILAERDRRLRAFDATNRLWLLLLLLFGRTKKRFSRNSPGRKIPIEGSNPPIRFQPRPGQHAGFAIIRSAMSSDK